jgi:O-antigen/teichoic acid export membrane protein
MLVSAALVGLWPAFGDALARGDVVWARRALKRAAYMALLGMGVMCAVLAFAIGWFSKLWLGMQAEPPLLLTTLLSVWVMIDALGMVCGTFLNGAGILRAQAIVALAMATASFVGKWVLVEKIGVAGGVLATIIAYSLISVPAQIVMLRRFFNSTGTSAMALKAAEATGPRALGIEKT